MKTGIAVALVALGGVIVQPLRLEAAGPDPNLKATRYSTSLVQPMDQCTSSVSNVGRVAACTPSNSSTDGTHFPTGKVLIRELSGGRQVVTALHSSAATP